MNTRAHRLLVAITTLLFSASLSVADAHPPGGLPVGPPAGIPGGPRIPVAPPIQPGLPSQSNQGTAHNPNGRPPSGAATSAPDTDRGNSEGKGRTDTAGSHAFVGSVTAFNGTTLTLKLPNGTTKTFTVDAHAHGQLRAHNGQNVAIHVDAQGRVTQIAPADQTISGKVSGVTKNTVTLTLPNGRTQTIGIASQAAAHISLMPGAQATIVSHDGGRTASSITVRGKHQSAKGESGHRH
jgi:hypothetical protein